MLPVLFGIGHLLWVGMGYAWMKLVRRRSAFGGTLQLSCFITNAEEFRESWMHSFSNWLALLVILEKMAGMARIQVEMGAWCFVALFIVLTLVSAFYDREALWDRVEALRRALP